eukprot:COSAG06_NODE_13679_length_1232_cov_1.300088_2_plen_221_part_00
MLAPSLLPAQVRLPVLALNPHRIDSRVHACGGSKSNSIQHPVACYCKRTDERTDGRTDERTNERTLPQTEIDEATRVLRDSRGGASMNIVISSEPGLYVVQRGDELSLFGSSVAPSVAHQLAISTDSSSSAGVDVFALRSSHDSSPPCVAPAAARGAGAFRSVPYRADSVVCTLGNYMIHRSRKGTGCRLAGGRLFYWLACLACLHKKRARQTHGSGFLA